MISYHIAAAACVGPNAGMSPDERQRLSTHLPRAAVRRISDNGVQISALLNQLEAADGEPLVLASRFAEGCALEAYLQSFPTPSPTRFQTSVHPSGVQQGRVAQARPLRTLLPMGGHATLGLLCCRSALFSGAPSVIVVGAEEKASWLADLGAASAVGFCFALRLTEEAPAASLGSIEWTYDADGHASDLTDLLALFNAVRERRPCVLSHPDIGTVRIQWR